MSQITLKIAMPPETDEEGKPKTYTGRIAGLMFDKGVHLSDSEGAALNRGQREYFMRKGYAIEGSNAELGAVASKRRKGGRKSDGEE